MSLNEKEALERADEFRKSVWRNRAAQDAQWALNMAYATGKAWSFISSQPTGRKEVKRLREIIDPDSTDVRVSMDIVHQNLVRTVAALKPQKISAMIRVRSGEPDAMTARHVFNGILLDRLPAINALEVWRSLHGPRCILGTVGVRRQIVTEGRPVTLPADYQADSKIPLRLRNLQVQWARVLPFEILRDPAANSLDPDIDDTIVGHEKPRTTEWVFRNYGKKIVTETTFGDLMKYQDNIRSATGWWWQQSSAQDSRQPAVVVYEFALQDADTGPGWPWHLIAYYDPNDKSGKNLLVPLHFGRSPFYGLFLNLLHYDDTNLTGCWGRGLPELLKPLQDIRNIAATTMIRVMIDHYPKWRIEEGTVDVKNMSNRTDMPLIFKRNPSLQQHIPDRLSAPGANPVAETFLGMLSSEAGNAVSIAPVMRGEMVKRGQANSAYETVIEQGEVPLNDLRKDDEIVLNKLLYGTLIDTVRLLRFRRDIAQKTLPEFSKEQLAAALREDPVRMVLSVNVTPESLRHRTPTQIRNDFVGDVQSQLLSPVSAQREMLVQGDIVTDTQMAEAWRKQELELDMILAGQEVFVVPGEDHATSIWVLTNFMSSTRWYSLSEKQQDDVAFHWANHMEQKQAEQLAAMGGMGGQSSGGEEIAASGSPPAPSAEQAPQGSAGPIMSVTG